MNRKTNTIMIMIILMIATAFAQTIVKGESFGKLVDNRITEINDNIAIDTTPQNWDMCINNEIAKVPLCIKSSKAGSIYFKEINDTAIEYAYNITDAKEGDIITIIYNGNPEFLGYKIDYGDFYKNGIIFDENANKTQINIYNPEKEKGWIDPVITITGTQYILSQTTQKKIVQSNENHTFIITTTTGAPGGMLQITELNKYLNEIAEYMISNVTGYAERNGDIIKDDNNIAHITWNSWDGSTYKIKYQQFNLTSKTKIGTAIEKYTRKTNRR